MSGPRFDEIEGEEVAPSFDAIDGDVVQEATAPATAPVVAPDGPVLRAPERSAWNTLRDVAEASGTVPRGLIPDEGTARGAVASILQGPTLNWADETAGLLNERDALLRYMVEGGQKPNPGQEYREGRDAFRNVEGAFSKENPAAAFALQMGSGAALGGPVGVEGKAGYLLPRALWKYGPWADAGVRYLPALVEGGIAGAGAAAESEDIPEAAAVGAPLSVAGQAFGEVFGDIVGAGMRRLGQSSLATGIVKPSKEAEYLRSKHVGGLTIGQMAPESKLAQLEEASTSTAGIGPAIKGQRDVAQQQWQQAVMREALPPGQAEAIGDDLGEQMASVFGGFTPAYDVAKGLPVSPQSVQAALQAIDDPTIYASDATRQQVARFIEDQMTALRPRSDGSIDSGDVIALRSFIRQRIRNLPEDARQDRELFQATADALTDALDTELPSDVGAALRAADMQYAKAKTVADAVGRSRDQVGGFTTKQLSTAVAQNTPESVYQQGGGGELRRLAKAGEQTLAPKIPLTGARLLASGPVPYLTGPLAYAMNLPGPKAALMGQTALQQSIQRSAPAAGQFLGDEVSRLGPAAAYAQRNVAERQERGDTTSSSLVEGVVSSNPEALGAYAQQLQQAAADGNLPIVHYALQQKDPNYRRMLDGLREGGTQ